MADVKEKTTRRVYSAEELQRLRVSCSQPKLREAIEELDGEDAELVKGIICHSCTPELTHKHQRVALAAPFNFQVISNHTWTIIPTPPRSPHLRHNEWIAFSHL